MVMNKICDFFTRKRSLRYFDKMSSHIIIMMNKQDGTRLNKDRLLNHIEYYSHLININVIHYDMAMELWADFFKVIYKSYIVAKDKKSRNAYPNFKRVIKRLKE